MKSADCGEVKAYLGLLVRRLLVHSVHRRHHPQAAAQGIARLPFDDKVAERRDLPLAVARDIHVVPDRDRDRLQTAPNRRAGEERAGGRKNKPRENGSP